MRGKTNEEDNKIDTFQRRSFCNILGIKCNKGYGKTIRNLIKSQIKLNDFTICIHELTLLEILQDDKAPLKVSLQETIRPTKRSQENPPNTLLSIIKKIR